jgi:HEAT repeat protein
MRLILIPFLFACGVVAASAAPSPPGAPSAPPTAPEPPERPEPPAAIDDDADAPPATEAEALAIDALEGLIAAPPQRALPLVKKVLAGSQTLRVKRRAMFVLGMIDLPEAGQLLAETARNSHGPLQREAIRALGIRGGKDLSAALQQIHQGGDAATRAAVIEAFMISGDKAALLAVAKAAKQPNEAREAINALGALGARAELSQLAQQGQYSTHLMHAFAIAGDLDGLMRIATTSADMKLRAEAVQSIGIIGGAPAKQALRKLYADASDAQIRQAALEGRLISGDEQGVLQLYRAATQAERKRELLRTLTMMGGDAALEAIDAALEGKAP